MKISTTIIMYEYEKLKENLIFVMIMYHVPWDHYVHFGPLFTRKHFQNLSKGIQRSRNFPFSKKSRKMKENCYPQKILKS